MLVRVRRYLWPVLAVALGFALLCAVTAVSLLNEQASINRILRENVASQQAAVRLEECLVELANLDDDRGGAVGAMGGAGAAHAQVRELLERMGHSADQPLEVHLHDEASAGFDEYLGAWAGLPPPGSPERALARRRATQILRVRVLRPCEEYKRYNMNRIQDSIEGHERVLGLLAWGMAGVGGFGATAGVVAGYGVARGVARSISRLRVQLQTAAGKLDPRSPELVLTQEGDFPELHAEAERLSRRIEELVSRLHEREVEVLRTEQLAAVGQLAAGVAHEIRNPLTSIKMLVQFGIEDRENRLSLEDLTVIEAEVRRMERSLNTFLNFARPPKPERRPTELCELVRGVAGLVRGRAEQQRVRVELGLPPGGLRVVADGEQIRQVLVNLCLNGLDAMPSGGALSVTAEPLPGGGAELAVADTGAGIAKAMLPRLFTPFASSKDTGLGLGLVLSRRIAEDHGGALVGGNRKSGGARFTLTLPAAADPTPAGAR